MTFVSFTVCSVVERLSHYGLPLLTFCSVHSTKSALRPQARVYNHNVRIMHIVYCCMRTLLHCAAIECVAVPTFSIFVRLLMRLLSVHVCVCAKSEQSFRLYLTLVLLERDNLYRHIRIHHTRRTCIGGLTFYTVRMHI